MPQPRVVVVTTTIGHDSVPHAGGVYLKALCDTMGPLVDLTVMVPGSRSNRDAARQPGAPEHVVPLGLEPASSLVGRGANRFVLLLDGRWRRRDPGMAYLPLLLGLARSGEARQAIRDADVIDFQWSDSIRLVHLLRRLNPRARVVGTFHDVMSQSFAREPQHTRHQRRYWQGAARRSRRHERRMVRALDEVLVFSEKDAELLGSPPHLRVVQPPLYSGAAPQHEPDPSGRIVLVVSYLVRDENDKAAHWTIDHVWPHVRHQVPGAQLRFVGGGALPGLVEKVSPEPDVVLAGFVDDLDGEYAAASVALVPVLQGAGVKFKAIDALVHGVPLASTACGMEGIDGPDLTAGLTDDPRALAGALVAVLRDPAGAQPRADTAQRWAAERYGRERFEEAISAAWGLTGPE